MKFTDCFRNRLDELRAFLENEAWEICPVRTSFTYYSLRVSYKSALMYSLFLHVSTYISTVGIYTIYTSHSYVVVLYYVMYIVVNTGKLAKVTK